MKTIQFYYVRHGETIFNITNKSQGSCDSPLTSKGIKQAQQCAKHLEHFHFDKVFCSTSERAIDTANIIVENKDLEIIPLKGLKEMSFGILEGERNDILDTPMSNCWKQKDFTQYGGENKEQFIKRIQDTFNHIVDACENNDTCLIVSHRGYFYYMLEALFNQSLDLLEKNDPNFLSHLIPNASIAKFQYHNGKWILLELPK